MSVVIHSVPRGLLQPFAFVFTFLCPKNVETVGPALLLPYVLRI